MSNHTTDVAHNKIQLITTRHPCLITETNALNSELDIKLSVFRKSGQ